MQFNRKLRASKCWLEWNACNGSGFSCLTFHWRLTCYSHAKFINENEKVTSIMKILWRFLLLSAVAVLQKFLCIYLFFFPYLKFSKDFPFVENIVLTKIRPPQRALKPVKINKTNGIEISRCFGFQPFRKLFNGMGCINIKISPRNFCSLLVNGKRCRQVL